jgi:hypothetical protein
MSMELQEIPVFLWAMAPGSPPHPPPPLALSLPSPPPVAGKPTSPLPARSPPPSRHCLVHLHGRWSVPTPGLPPPAPPILSPSTVDGSSRLIARSTAPTGLPARALIVAVSGLGAPGHHQRGLQIDVLGVLYLSLCRL